MRRTQNRSRHSALHGMTLIEIMVVLVILGMIAGMIGVNVMHERAVAQNGTAALDVQNIANAVDLYELHHQRIPISLDELVPNELKSIRKDPWGQLYVYHPSISGFEVLSCGPDKVEGGGDDISSKDLQKQ